MDGIGSPAEAAAMASDTVVSPATSPKRPDSKICGVCGDKALGYNFNAVTCESCKAFFRRNALKKKEFKCPFSDNCKVDVVTRRFCQKCRLRKCFDIGMKKEWIMTEEEKKAKKQKIEDNRHKRYGEVSDTSLLASDAGDEVPEHPKPQARVKGVPHYSSTPTLSATAIVIDTPKEGIGDDNAFTNISELSSEYDSLLSPGSSSTGGKETFSPLQLEVLSTSMECSPCGEKVSSRSPSTVSMTSRDVKVAYTLSPDDGVHSMASVPSAALHTPGIQLCIKVESPKEADRPADRGKEAIQPCGSPSTSTASPSLSSTRDIMNNVLNVALRTEFRRTGQQIQCTTGEGDEASVRTNSSNTNEFHALMDSDRARLNELITANKALKMPISDEFKLGSATDSTLINVINLTDVAIRRLIKMAKRIAGFKNLCQEDQIALLKGGCTELMILRSVMTYNPENDCWLGPKGPKMMRIKLDVLREAKGNLYEEHKRFIHSFERNWRTDENIMLILSAITLFTADRPNVIHRDVIIHEQDSYYFLLHRYLQSLYSGCEARSAYQRLTRRIKELRVLNENHVRVFLDVNPKDVEPLLIEIFDLKNH